MCAGYELKAWRGSHLASHLIEWLPEFALKDSERAGLGAHNAVALLQRAARSIYTSEKYKNRGEFGELLLHVVMRQEFGTVPAISKYFYKSASNDTVKGFDAVHVVQTAKKLELWLGEVKFYSDIADAIREVVSEMEAHTQRDYLKDECIFIENKIDDKWPHASALRALIHRNRSIDDIVSAVCIPVLLTYESPTVAAHNAVTAAFQKALEIEVRSHHATFCSKPLPTNVRVHLILVPLGLKKVLVEAFDTRLKGLQ